MTVCNIMKIIIIFYVTCNQRFLLLFINLGEPYTSQPYMSQLSKKIERLSTLNRPGGLHDSDVSWGKRKRQEGRRVSG